MGGRKVRAQQLRGNRQTPCLSQADGEESEYRPVQIHHLLGKDRRTNAADDYGQVKSGAAPAMHCERAWKRWYPSGVTRRRRGFESISVAWFPASSGTFE